jgi:hypothetical protein
MTRKQALTCIKAAGAQNDQAAFVRLYVENRISYAVAMAAYREGEKFGAFIAKRDAINRPTPFPA